LTLTTQTLEQLAVSIAYSFDRGAQALGAFGDLLGDRGPGDLLHRSPLLLRLGAQPVLV